MIENPTPKANASGDLTKEKKNLGILFVVFLLIKLGFLAAGYFTNTIAQLAIVALVIPIAAMLVYMAWGWKISKQVADDDFWEMYGDSCYYMGFLFTIGSIILVLIAIGTKFSFESVAILLGVAMTTTLIGMVMRLYVQMFCLGNKIEEKSPDDPGDLITGTTQEINGHVRFVVDVNTDKLSFFNNLLDDQVSKFQRLSDSMASLEARVQNDLETNVKTVTSSQVAILEKFGKKVEETGDLVKTNSTSLIDELRGALEKTNSNFSETLSNSATQFSESLKTLEAKRKTETRALSEVLDGRLSKMSDEAIARIDKVAEKASDSIEQNTSKSLSAIDSLAAGISTPIKAVTAASDGLSARNSELTESIERLNKAYEIATAVLNNVGTETASSIGHASTSALKALNDSQTENAKLLASIAENAAKTMNTASVSVSESLRKDAATNSAAFKEAAERVEAACRDIAIAAKNIREESEKKKGFSLFGKN